MLKLSDNQVWTAIRAATGTAFSTLSGASQVMGRQVGPENVTVQTLPAQPDRQIPRQDVLLIYRELWKRKGGRLTLQDIRPGTSLGDQRRSKAYVGASLLGLLLHAFPEDFEKANQGRTVGLRVRTQA